MEKTPPTLIGQHGVESKANSKTSADFRRFPQIVIMNEGAVAVIACAARGPARTRGQGRNGVRDHKHNQICGVLVIPDSVPSLAPAGCDHPGRRPRASRSLGVLRDLGVAFVSGLIEPP
jgi:hypothetical protein